MSKWIRRGDRVVVLAGNDRGKTGEVLSRDTKKVLVQGINMRKKHMKRTQEIQTAQIVEMEMPINISNLSISDAYGKPIRLSVRMEKDGSRTLVYKDKGEVKVYRPVRKPAE